MKTISKATRDPENLPNKGNDMSYRIGGHPQPKPVTAEEGKKKAEKSCCPCFGRKVEKRVKHDKKLTAHEIDFTKLLRAEKVFEEKKK